MKLCEITNQPMIVSLINKLLAARERVRVTCLDAYYDLQHGTVEHAFVDTDGSVKLEVSYMGRYDVELTHLDLDDASGWKLNKVGDEWWVKRRQHAAE